MADTFQAALGPDVKVYSQAQIMADSLADYLIRHPQMAGGGQPCYVTTGDPQRVSERATQFLRRDIRFEAM